jgi:hypothetical protein
MSIPDSNLSQDAPLSCVVAPSSENFYYALWKEEISPFRIPMLRLRINQEETEAMESNE